MQNNSQNLLQSKVSDLSLKEVIESFKETFPTREEVATKKELAELKESFGVLQTSMDNVVVRFDKFQLEMLAVNHRVTRLEKHTGII